jgi:hypothetical protein
LVESLNHFVRVQQDRLRIGILRTLTVLTWTTSSDLVGGSIRTSPRSAPEVVEFSEQHGVAFDRLNLLAV